VLVGLFVNRLEHDDEVDEVLRRDAFQRACVELSHERGAASGRIGGHGITFVCASRGSAARTRRFLTDLAARAGTLARRRFGLDLHVGLGELPASLPDQYRCALAAAESALSGGEQKAAEATGLFWRELPTLVRKTPGAIPAHFDRYLESVAVRSGHNLDLARARLETAFEPLLSTVAATDALDTKSLAALLAALGRTAGEANTLSELFAAYRSTVKDIAGALGAPRPAARDRSLRRAEEYVKRHYAEAFTLEQVARSCGLASSHFSRLFHAKHGVTFRSYVMRQRVEIGRQLLSRTSLNLQRVAQLCGLSTRYYFGRVFRRSAGETPIAYRRRVRGA
jgi:AraC-like DNA-binding protein